MLRRKKELVRLQEVLEICNYTLSAVIVPDKDPGNCPDPELPGTSTGGDAVRGAGQAGAGPPGPPNIWGNSSRDPARMEETCAEIPPAGSRRDTAASAANRMRTLQCIHKKSLCSF